MNRCAGACKGPGTDATQRHIHKTLLRFRGGFDIPLEKIEAKGCGDHEILSAIYEILVGDITGGSVKLHLEGFRQSLRRKLACDSSNPSQFGKEGQKHIPIPQHPLCAVPTA